MLKKMVCLLVICGLMFSVGLPGCKKKDSTPDVSGALDKVKKDADKAAKDASKEAEEVKESMEN